MNPLFLIVNIIGLLVFIAIAYIFSKDRKSVDFKSLGIVLVLELAIGAILTLIPICRDGVKAVADGFAWLMNSAFEGIVFALPDWIPLSQGGTSSGSMNFVTSALLPILLMIPLFDILTYFGILPFIIKWLGRGISFLTRRPMFESFFSIEQMFLGNTEAMGISRLQLQKMSPLRNLTIAMMSMSSVSAAIIGAYIQMVPGQFIITAIPLNVLSCIVITSILNPVKIENEEDFVVQANGEIEFFGKASKKEDSEALIDAVKLNTTNNDTFSSKNNENLKKPPFFSYLGDSILAAGKMILIIFAMVVAFVAITSLINNILGLFGQDWLKLENIFGVILFPFAWLLNADPTQAFSLAQIMGTKLVTNEFVAFGSISDTVTSWAPHLQAVTVVFLCSFANFSTVGIVTGCFKDIGTKESNLLISKEVPRLFLSGVLVSLVSAATIGLFIW